MRERPGTFALNGKLPPLLLLLPGTTLNRIMNVFGTFFHAIYRRRLPNYLRAHRKRLGLSQKDVAFLLGCKSGAKLSRYERFKTEPQLETAFMCGFIACQPLNILFEGLYRPAARKVARRARVLLRRYRRMPRTHLVEKKIKALEALGERR
jgi:transcriptional regulator with XRE-family HTH domain